MTEKEKRYHNLYLEIAETCAEMSFSERKKVGCVVVKNNNIIAMGWNGMPTGMSNVCEDETSCSYCEGVGSVDVAHGMIDCPHCNGTGRTLNTKRECLHAELNALSKLAKSTNSSEGSTLYVTLSPCIDCAKLIVQAGVKTVVYEELYRDRTGIELLEKCGIEVLKLTNSTNRKGKR